MEGPLRITYARLRDAVLWDANPKRHDMGGLVQSIRVHGFRDAPILDAALGAIVAGNGRTTALQEMRAAGRQPEDEHWPPLGVVVDPEDGEWWVPFQTGIDSPTAEQAESFGLDHNLLTATGGDLGFAELCRLHDHAKLAGVAQRLLAAGVGVITLDPDDLEAIVNPPPPAEVVGGAGGGAERGPRMLTCPHCGHAFEAPR